MDYRTRFSLLSYGEGEGDLRKVENGSESSKIVHNFRVRPLLFEVVDWVYLNVSSMKGVMRFGKKGKLITRYICPYSISKRVVNVSYELEVHQELTMVHLVFHISMLKKCLGDPSLIVPTENIGIDSFSYEKILVKV